MSQPSVAVLGLGAMGHAFASNLLKEGFITFGWNRTRTKGEDMVSQGLILIADAEKTVERADVVIFMLSDPTATAEVFKRVLPFMKQGTIICQMSTIGTKMTDHLIAETADKRSDIVYIDAPVSGSKTPAEKAQVLVLASGEREKATAVDPVFAALGKKTLWLGTAGTGSRMKLVLNCWLNGQMQSLFETVRLAEEFGFTVDDLWQALNEGPLKAPYVRTKLSMLQCEDYTPQVQLRWALKDAQLALESLDMGQLPALNIISNVWQEAVEAGYGEQDVASVFRYLKQK
jgi:3-hydroxyisobutyrate dehydrogenase